MKIHECEQGSREWWDLRAGIPTASCFDKVLTPTGAISAQADKYINQLIAERLGDFPEGVESFTSRAMRHGINTEREARSWYELERETDVLEVGFITTDDGRFGCSPDGLIGEDGGLELKCPEMHTHIGYLREGGLPAKYRLQVHGSMFVTGRPWWDFMSYCFGLKPVLVRVERDTFTDKLGQTLFDFAAKLKTAHDQIEALRGSIADDGDNPF